MENSYRYHSEEKLRTGTPVIVRDVREYDKEALSKAFQQQKPETLYQRFFVAKKELRSDELRFLTEVDFKRHIALGLQLEDGEGIAIARYIRDEDNPSIAEIAFTVADAWQGKGAGPILLKHLVKIARGQGVKAFTAEVLASNKAMLRVFERSGLPVRQQWKGGSTLEVIIDLGAV